MPRCLAANSTCVCKGSNCQRLWVPASAAFCVVITFPPLLTKYPDCVGRERSSFSSRVKNTYFPKVSIYLIVPTVKDVIIWEEIWYTCAMTTPEQLPTMEPGETCATHPVGRALRLLGDVWTLIIVYTLISGTKRFGE